MTPQEIIQCEIFMEHPIIELLVSQHVFVCEARYKTAAHPRM
jgi:hypothetical protein